MTSVTQRRERKYKRAKLRLVDLSEPNLHDSDHVVALVAEASYAAVAKMFPWLSVDQIRNPPRRLLDAKLARQIAIHFMTVHANVPQRQIGRLQARQRTSIHFALKAVEKRLECDVFAAAYDQLEDWATEHYRAALPQGHMAGTV